MEDKSLDLSALKKKLQQKLKDVKSDLSSLNKKLKDTLTNNSTNLRIKYSNYLKNLRENTLDQVKDKEKRIKDKEIIGYFYYDAFRNIKRMEQFEKNLGEVIIDSLTNFNNFISMQLPYYKYACHQFLLNNEEK